MIIFPNIIGIDVDTRCNVYKFLSNLIKDEKSRVRNYFLNNVSEAAVTSCSGNPFHKDTDKIGSYYHT